MTRRSGMIGVRWYNYINTLSLLWSMRYDLVNS